MSTPENPEERLKGLKDVCLTVCGPLDAAVAEAEPQDRVAALTAAREAHEPHRKELAYYHKLCSGQEDDEYNPARDGVTQLTAHIEVVSELQQGE
jgi:hypothetical protein